jgi:hypothetical protein
MLFCSRASKWSIHGEHATATKFAPLFVRDDVVRIVGARTDVSERTQELAGQPRGGLEAQEISSLRGLGQDAIERAPIEVA